MKSYIPLQLCLNCGHSLDSLSDPFAEAIPSPGSICICAYCHHLAKYDEAGRLQSMTHEEIKLIELTEPEAWEKIQIAKMVMGKIPYQYQSHKN